MHAQNSVLQSAEPTGSLHAAAHQRESSVSLVDNRPGTVAQLVTRARWTTQNFQYNTPGAGIVQNEVVGKKLVADLDPADMRVGNETTSTEMAPLFTGLNANWNPGTLHWVRGHLLNAHLGGPNSIPNLFPITGHANMTHLREVESHVKGWMRANRNVHYEVTAKQESGNVGALRNARGRFECYGYTTDGGAREVVNKTIHSNPVPIVPGGGAAAAAAVAAAGPPAGITRHANNWWQYNDNRPGHGAVGNAGLPAPAAGMNPAARTAWNNNHIRRGWFWDDYAL